MNQIKKFMKSPVGSALLALALWELLRPYVVQVVAKIRPMLP